TLKEFKYKDIVSEKQQIASTGGWLGITDKYWLVALAPPQDEKIEAHFGYSQNADGNAAHAFYQTDFRGAATTLAPGGTLQHVTHMFAGAKRLRILDGYQDRLGIPLFDHAIDFGWFDFLTKPFLYLLDLLGRWLGNFGLAILTFTVMLKFV